MQSFESKINFVCLETVPWTSNDNDSDHGDLDHDDDHDDDHEEIVVHFGGIICMVSVSDAVAQPQLGR